MVNNPVRTADTQSAYRTAELLLDIGAVHFSPMQPFILSSGRPSPVYIDCRKLISFPRARDEVCDMLVELVNRNIGTGRLECIAGGETAGIPYAAFVADRMGLPMSYVRKKPKGHGRGKRIEGVIENDNRVLLVEDMSTDGGSKLDFIKAIRESGARCIDTAVVFYYGIFPRAEKRLAEAGIVLHHLTDWSHIMECQQARNLLKAEEHSEVIAFLDAPVDWQNKHMQ